MDLTFDDLVAGCGLTEHQVRHYIKKRFIPRSVGKGPYAKFNEEHLHRLLAIKRLRAQGVRLQEAAQVVGRTSGGALLELAGVEPPAPAPAADPAPAAVQAPSPSPPPSDSLADRGSLAYRETHARARELWEHIALCPGVELRVRFDADTEARRVASEIEAAWTRRGTPA
jgi:DNA-binding transcriptional MerR regulator